MVAVNALICINSDNGSEEGRRLRDYRICCQRLIVVRSARGPEQAASAEVVIMTTDIPGGISDGRKAPGRPRRGAGHRWAAAVATLAALQDEYRAWFVASVAGHATPARRRELGASGAG